MPRVRLSLGLVAATLAIGAAMAGGRSLIINIELAHGVPALLLTGLLTPALMGATAALLGRIAYRNLFWHRYVSGRRTTRPHQSRRL